MPNHLHLILWPTPDQVLSEILRSRKRYAARQANPLLGRTGGSFREHESYDHWIRRYIRNNPVTAGLCRLPDECRWSSVYVSGGQNHGLPTP